MAAEQNLSLENVFCKSTCNSSVHCRNRRPRQGGSNKCKMGREEGDGRQ